MIRALLLIVLAAVVLVAATLVLSRLFPSHHLRCAAGSVEALLTNCEERR